MLIIIPILILIPILRRVLLRANQSLGESIKSRSRSKQESRQCRLSSRRILTKSSSCSSSKEAQLAHLIKRSKARQHEFIKASSFYYYIGTLFKKKNPFTFSSVYYIRPYYKVICSFSIQAIQVFYKLDTSFILIIILFLFK